MYSETTQYSVVSILTKPLIFCTQWKWDLYKDRETKEGEIISFFFM